LAYFHKKTFGANLRHRCSGAAGPAILLKTRRLLWFPPYKTSALSAQNVGPRRPSLITRPRHSCDAAAADADDAAADDDAADNDAAAAADAEDAATDDAAAADAAADDAAADDDAAEMMLPPPPILCNIPPILRYEYIEVRIYILILSCCGFFELTN
jgi:hypothetical protein